MPDYPPWLQEIVLRCIEIEPAWRYPTAAQLAFALSHPSQVKLTARSERLKRDPWTTVLRRRFNRDLTWARAEPALAAKLASAPIVAVAVDLAEGSAAVNDALRVAAGRILATLPSARLACINVLKLGLITLDTTLDEHGRNKHIDRLVALRHWAEPLKLEEQRRHRACARGDRSRCGHSRIRAGQSCRPHTDRRATSFIAGQAARRSVRQGRRRGSLYRHRRPPRPHRGIGTNRHRSWRRLATSSGPGSPEAPEVRSDCFEPLASQPQSHYSP